MKLTVKIDKVTCPRCGATWFLGPWMETLEINEETGCPFCPLLNL